MNTVYWCIEFMITFIEVYISYIFCETFMNYKQDSKQVYYLSSSVIISAICIYCNHIELVSWIFSLIFYILCITAHQVISRKNFLKLIIVFSSYCCINVITDLLITGILNIISDVSDITVFTEFSIQRIITALTSKIVLCFFCIGINKIVGKDKLWDVKTGTLITFSALFLTIITYVTYMMYVEKKFSSTSEFMLLFFLVTLGMIFIMYYVMNSFIKVEKEKQEIEIIHFQNSFHEKALKEQDNAFELWRESIHNYKNTIIALNDMVNENKISELAEYLKNEADSFKDRGYYIRTGNSIIDTIINIKMKYAESLGISFTVNVRIPEKINVSDVDLSVIIGNLLDNAIEAQKNEKTRNINISIYYKQTFLFIDITNICTKQDFSLKTSKNGAFHGIGIESVKRTVKKYNGDLSIQKEESFVEAIAAIEY